MVFPEREEDEKWRPKEVKDALAAYEAKRQAGTLSGLKRPAHLTQYLLAADYEPDVTIRGSHGGRHNGHSSSAVVNSQGPQTLQPSKIARSAGVEQVKSATASPQHETWTKLQHSPFHK
ncbi:hypothetical protein IFR04_008585 [Cadophora malorum]|uniref:Uncharacterized protein n=1 Tax=Cadophora malorum TaxID=108018 RepID=A0A8H7TB38_9HELO|nr:hypothetical protein IFR04_008585 [Cadophora malorum]